MRSEELGMRNEELGVESGVWRVELKALGCLPCKGRGTAERWRGFRMRN